MKSLTDSKMDCGRIAPVVEQPASTRSRLIIRWRVGQKCALAAHNLAQCYSALIEQFDSQKQIIMNNSSRHNPPRNKL